MSNHQPASVGGPSSGTMASQQNQGPPPPGQNMSQQNLNQIVIEYLVKKGYHRTEQMLRHESSHTDISGKPIYDRAEDTGAIKYAIALRMLMDWIESNLDIYKSELKRLPWPVFVYSFLELVIEEGSAEAQAFREEFGPNFQQTHPDDMHVFGTLSLPQHVLENDTAKIYRNNKYRIPLNKNVYYNLVSHLETASKAGGSVIISLLSTYCEIRETDRGPTDQFTFESIIKQAKGRDTAETDLLEGIPGAFIGVSNKDIMDNNAILKLGMMPMELELAGDVRDMLADQDALHPPKPGDKTLVEEFDAMVKREDSTDGPTRNDIPLPPSRYRDVIMESQKVKEYRDRFRMDGRTGGIGAGICICMYTLHNVPLFAVNCLEFSDDFHLVAVGTSESYIDVYSLNNEKLTSTLPSDKEEKMMRRLIGHSGPVYSLSFSPSIEGLAKSADIPETHTKCLLSSSADATIRLWDLECWANLVVYKAHDGPVWNVRWGPFGHYFVSCGRDRSVRVWAQDHICYLRMMIGHDTSVCQIAWHPNGAYVFSASDESDKTVRMWSMTTADCVRIFVGHTAFITALECAPNGKILASADTSGIIILWDIAKGTEIKRCKGHKEGGIWSLSWCVESTAVASGSGDGTVRIWDVELPTDGSRAGDGDVIATGGQADATRINAASGAQAGAGPSVVSSAGIIRKRGKEPMITPDQISAFPTKKTPVLKVLFSRMNLLIAGGVYYGREKDW